MKIDQQIKGKNHQIAGRDIINEGDGFRPDPDNPNLMNCKICHWPGLSITADKCEKCGHNYLRERQVALANDIRERKAATKCVLGVVALVLLAALEVSGRTDLGYFESVCSVAVGGLILWGGVTYTLAALKTKLQQKERQ